MIDSDTDDSCSSSSFRLAFSSSDENVESDACGNRTSVTTDKDENNQQKEDQLEVPERLRCSDENPDLIELESFGNPCEKNDYETAIEQAEMIYVLSVSPLQTNIDDAEFDDFDPEKALVFENSLAPNEDSHSLQIHTSPSVKRKHNDMDDSTSKSSCNYKTHSVNHFTMHYAPNPNLDQLDENSKTTFLESAIINEYCARIKRPKLDMSQTAAWRLGPAKYWFDQLGVPESGDGFDYGFELADEMEEDEFDSFDDIDEDAFLMVSQVHWEDNIIWDIDDTVHELSNCKDDEWIPTENEAVLRKERLKIIESENGTCYSNFPVENEELVYGLWESEIIWDAKAMRTILQPKILEFDPSDENIVLSIPEDFDPTVSEDSTEAESRTKVARPRTKNVKSVLSKTGVIDDLDEEDTETSTLETLNVDPYNISNDIYYTPKSTENPDTSNQRHMPHSIPVLQLQPPLVPTYMGPKRLRNFHRSPLKLYKSGRLSGPGSHPVLSLTKYISKKTRKEALQAGELFFMRSFEDLSGRDGNLVLVEFSEEYPPLMNFVGMCSKIKNYYKRNVGKDSGPPEYKYGETAYSQSGLFLGNLRPGQSLQALENNIYRAPIYEHKVDETDFLVIRTRNQYYIREIDAIYVAGQQCPLYEVPAPNSKKVADFMRNFMQVFAYKTFLKSKSIPPKIHKDVLAKAFPNVKMPFVKRQLGVFANYIYKQGDPNCFHWVLKPNFRLPLEDEIRSLVSPEQCCAYFSMAAAQQRLKDAGYGDQLVLTLQTDDANEEEMQSRLDDEEKAAPWNTTRAYIEAVNGKCCLQLNGPADPTGCGEAFSYVKVPLKSVFKQDETELKVPKKVTGTEGDLRYLSINGAEKILRSYGVSTQDIKKLTRWEMIDAVRSLSTIREDRGEEGFAKFARSKRFSIAGCQQRYKEECQRIFDLQNRVLSSNEVFSSDDEDENACDVTEDVEKMAESIEHLLVSTEKSGSMLEFEREEREREELLKMLANEDAPKEEKPIEKKKEETNINPNAPRVLKIQRTFRNADFTEYTRTELVRDPAIIDAYLKIRSTKNATFIKQYANADEDLERERKKIEAQLKNIKDRERRKEKNQNRPVAVAPKVEPVGKKIRCGSCGRYGHTEASCSEKNKDLVTVDGTKLKFSMKLIKNAEEATSSTSAQSIPKAKALPKKRKRSSGDEQVDYSKHYQRPAGTGRQRTDPVVVLSTIFEEILTVIKGQKEFQPFLFPVNTKIVRNYRRMISRPMDLQTIRTNLQQKKYQSRLDFLGDFNQIKENSSRYNGQAHSLTDSAQRMLNMCVQLLAKKEKEIIKLENAINPPVDDRDQEAFSEMINTVIKEIKSMPEAVPFLKPVNKNLLGSREYYNIVKNPMDLETISKKIASHKYGSRADVINDFELIYNNCVLYNGHRSSMKTKAETLLKTVQKQFADLSHQILHLESSIASVQDSAMRQANIDTSWKYEVENDERNVVESETSEPGSLNLSEDDSEESTMDTDCFEQSAKSQFVSESKVTAKSSLDLSEDDSDDSSINNKQIQRNAQSPALPTIHETSVLEEDLQFSSDDDDL